MFERLFWKFRTRNLKGDRLRVANYEMRESVNLPNRFASLSYDRTLGGREIDYIYRLVLGENFEGPVGEYEFRVNTRPTYWSAKRYFEERGIFDKKKPTVSTNLKKFVTVFGEHWEVTSVSKMSKRGDETRDVEMDELDGIAEIFCRLFFEMNSRPVGATIELYHGSVYTDQLNFEIYGREITPGKIFKARDFAGS